MRYEKKQITKEDGRYVVFYHFPDCATESQMAAFRGVDELPPNLSPVDVPDTADRAAAPASVDKEKPGV